MLEPIPDPHHSPAAYGPAAGGAPPGAGQASCPDCASRASAMPQQFVYALGHIEVRFPTLGLEREYQQRERMLPPAPGKPHLERVREVLVHNLHLAAQACFLLTIGGSPAYLLAPAGNYLRPSLFDALGAGEDSFAVTVGRLGPMAPPQACGGVLVPVLLCDQIYTFRLGDWQAALSTGLQEALAERGIDQHRFGEAARALFRRIVQSTENIGATDVHRALNYLVMQHPGIFLLAAEKQERHQLDRIETRLVQGPSARRQVAVILSFVERSTGVVERYFTRVDITEEWPFVSDAEGGRGAIGLSPYLENSMLGMPL
jgi:hypothetical protein